MKIVHCMFSMQTGGAEILTVALANKMCDNNEVSVVIVNNIWEAEIINQFDKRVKLYFLRRNEGSRNPFPIINLNILLYRLRPDIIHCHDPKMGRIIKVKTAKVVYTIHELGIPVDYYHHYDLLVAISDAVFKDVESKCSYPMKTIYNGIPTEFFNRRNKYKLIEEEPLKLIQISRLVHETKGQDVLLFALSKLKSEDGVNFTLDLVGSGSSKAYLVHLVRELGLEGNVKFLGVKEREWVYANLVNYHLLVQPSRFEGFGLTILEGLAAGLPVLASNSGGPLEILKKTNSGYLFKNGDHQSCAMQLKQIFKMYKNGQMSSHMQNEEDTISEQYSIEACAAAYIREYKSLAFSTTKELNSTVA